MRNNIEGVVGELTTFPGCSQLVVSHSVFATPSVKGKGKAKEANLRRQILAFEELGYDAMICTVVSTNEVQKHILRDTGWEFLTLFTSSKTGNTVELWACYKN